MKIAVASEGKNKNAEVSQRGGRAPYYLIFEDKKLIETIKNPFATGAGGAGFSVAYMLADKKVDLVIAGKFGGNMESALKEKGIKFKEESGKKVEEVI
ncbi:NifB/NifX family molybdenum-iron cluster-binding protein [Candidatus Woesearchaeota archaeon]|nr:NifB/NifX family molybdenum-iron cluster-binding protein [Candidatus Woesearchaeota archaeon]